MEPRSRRAVLRRYVAAFNACEKGSQWERTLKPLREMWQRGWRPWSQRPAATKWAGALAILGCSACETASTWERTRELYRRCDQVHAA